MEILKELGILSGCLFADPLDCFHAGLFSTYIFHIRISMPMNDKKFRTSSEKFQ